MQVNDSWLPKLAAHWKASKEETYRALRDEVCANIEGGAWILRQASMKRMAIYGGVGLFHSHKEAQKRTICARCFSR